MGLAARWPLGLASSSNREIIDLFLELSGLAGLFAVSVTGLFLTVSSLWLEGKFYAALNTIQIAELIAARAAG